MRPRSLRTFLATVTAGLAAAGTLTAAGPSRADAPQRHACSPAVSIDGFSDALDKTTYEGTFVGNFSALAQDLSHSRPRSSGGTPTGSLLAPSDRSALLTDLVTCPSLGATARQPQPNPLLDNIEGMTITGRGAGGRLRVLLVSDDNQNAVQITRFYRLSVRWPLG